MSKPETAAPPAKPEITVIPWDGKKIAKPGVYEMPLDSYHTDCCIGPSISSSGLRTIENESPAHYWFDSPLNPKRMIDDDQKPHFSLGSAVHTLLLGEKGFGEKFVVRPEKWADWRTGAAQAWRDEMVALKKTVLIPKDLDVIRGLASSMMQVPIIKGGLFTGYTEKSLIWQDKETGIWLKARPDTIQSDAAAIVDLKTCDSADYQSCQRAIGEYGYHMQLALAGMGMEEVLGRQIPGDGYVLVFAEKKPPFAINIKPVTADAIYKGRLLVRRALKTFAACWASKAWPGYADSEAPVSLPAWLDNRLDAQIERGELG